MRKMFNLPVLRRRFKAVDFINHWTLAPGSLGAATLEKESDLEEASSFLLEVANNQFPRRYVMFMDAKGGMRYFPDFYSNKNKNYGRSMVGNFPSSALLNLNCGLFVLSALESRIEGAKLIDRLVSVNPILTAQELELVDCFADNRATSLTRLKTLAEAAAEELSTNSSLNESSILKFKSLVDAFEGYQNLQTKDVSHPIESIILNLIANHVKTLRDLFIHDDGKKTTKVVNAIRVELPYILNNSNKEKLANLVLAFQREQAFRQCYDQEQIGFKDVYDADGSITANINYNILKKQFDKVQKVFVAYSLFEYKFNRALSHASTFITDTLYMSTKEDRSLDITLRRLIPIFLDTTDGNVSKLEKPVDEVQAELNTIGKRFETCCLPYINTVLDMYYEDGDLTNLRGFTIRHSYVKANDVVSRIEKLATDSKQNFKFIGALLSNKKIFDVDSLSIEPTIKMIPGDANLRVNIPDYHLSGEGGTSSKYGCAIIGLNGQRIKELITGCCTYISCAYSEELNLLTIDSRMEAYTLLPPSKGPDVLSFGVTSRREYTGDRFYYQKISDLDNADLIDLLFAFPLSQLNGLDDEGLRRAYTNRLKSLFQSDPLEENLLFSQVKKLSVLKPTLRFFSAVVGDAEYHLDVLSDTFILPDKCSSNAIENSALPYAIKTPKYVNIDLTLPTYCFTDYVLSQIRQYGEFLGYVGRDGQPIVTIRPVEKSKGRIRSKTVEEYHVVLKALPSDTARAIMLLNTILTKYQAEPNDLSKCVTIQDEIRCHATRNVLVSCQAMIAEKQFSKDVSLVLSDEAQKAMDDYNQRTNAENVVSDQGSEQIENIEDDGGTFNLVIKFKKKNTATKIMLLKYFLDKGLVFENNQITMDQSGLILKTNLSSIVQEMYTELVTVDQPAPIAVLMNNNELQVANGRLIIPEVSNESEDEVDGTEKFDLSIHLNIKDHFNLSTGKVLSHGKGNLDHYLVPLDYSDPLLNKLVSQKVTSCVSAAGFNDLKSGFFCPALPIDTSKSVSENVGFMLEEILTTLLLFLTQPHAGVVCDITVARDCIEAMNDYVKKNFAGSTQVVAIGAPGISTITNLTTKIKSVLEKIDAYSKMTNKDDSDLKAAVRQAIAAMNPIRVDELEVYKVRTFIPVFKGLPGVLTQMLSGVIASYAMPTLVSNVASRPWAALVTEDVSSLLTAICIRRINDIVLDESLQCVKVL